MKKLKLTHERGDFISELPEEVLCSILSLLPMKDKVKTSILSSRWRYQWASTPYLDFHIHTMNERITNTIQAAAGKLATQDEESLQVVNSEFVRSVSKILQLYRGPKIHSFTVSYSFDQVTSCHLDRWIEFAIAMGVESLKLNLLYPPYLPINLRRLSNSKLYTFPCFLLSHDHHHGKTSSTLKHLQLALCILDVPPAGLNFNGFRTLSTLDLQDVKLIMNESSCCCLQNLFSSCLLLQVLSMRRCILPANLEAVGPCMKNLKCLEIFGCFGVRNILVSAMKLTTFGYDGGSSLLNLSLHSVPELERLYINFSGGSMQILSSVLSQLPKHLPQLESLFIQSTLEIRTQPALMLASFVNLKELELEEACGPSANLLWIASTINALPLLLKLHVMLISCGRLPRIREERKMNTSGFPHNQLKEVLITGFKPFIYQVELVICLLKNAVALERMTIDPNKRYYNTNLNFRKMELVVSNMFALHVWDEREKNNFYEALHREVPGTASLVTICNH